jgi:RNA polymerase sigma factor (sigma-70 family)
MEAEESDRLVTGSPSAPHQLDLVPDALLAGRAADGETAAFEALARRHGPLIRACARRLTGSLADADDLVQESLMQAWKQLDTLRDGDAVKTWLLRITGSRSIDHLRPGRSIPLRSDSPEDVLTETEGSISALIRSVADSLPGTAAGKCRLSGDVTRPGGRRPRRRVRASAGGPRRHPALEAGNGRCPADRAEHHGD